MSVGDGALFQSLGRINGTAYRLEAQLFTIMCKARVNPVFVTEPPNQRVEVSRIAAYDLRSTMGKDGMRNARGFTPAELHGDSSMADPGPTLSADHGALNGRSIADVKDDLAKRIRTPWERSYVGKIEKSDRFKRHAVADGWGADRMMDRECFEAYSSDDLGSSQRHPASIVDGKTTEQIQRFLSRVDWAWRAFGKTKGMIGMCVSEHDGSWCNSVEPAQPIRSTIDHYAGILVPHQQ
ncbi:MAG TPA: hypothetical protein VLZ74_14970 [Methylocella sp.]|nr:hypothetical protein [Methylocella sp.]